MGSVVRHVGDMRSLLEGSSLPERKAFIKAFVSEMVVERGEIKMSYVLPLSRAGRRHERLPVLSVVQNGSPVRIRTSDLAVNSRMLYR